MKLKIRRMAIMTVASAAILASGAGAAQAWTWAGTTNPISMSGGGGYGNLVPTGYANGTMQTWLRDTQLDGQRIYGKFYAQRGSNIQDVFGRSTGNRADGGSSYARMADTPFYSNSPYGVAQYKFYVNTCRDAPFSDPCSEDTRSHTGL